VQFQQSFFNFELPATFKNKKPTVQHRLIQRDMLAFSNRLFFGDSRVPFAQFLICTRQVDRNHTPQKLAFKHEGTII
jgi:hypothetical protein